MRDSHLLSIEKLRKFRERAGAAVLAASRASGQSAADAVTSFEGELASHSALQLSVEASLYEKALANVMTNQQMQEMSQRIQEGRRQTVKMGERLLQLKVQAAKAAADAEVARSKYAASLRSFKKWEKLRERFQKQAALDELRRDEGPSLDFAISTNEIGSSTC